MSQAAVLSRRGFGVAADGCAQKQAVAPAGLYGSIPRIPVDGPLPTTTSQSVSMPSVVRKPKQESQLVDTFGRKHSYLRVSLTDRCNMRCKYCMPEELEEEEKSSAVKSEYLTADEIQRVVGLFTQLGVRKVRLTGGEPTIRSDFGRIVSDLGDLSHSLPEPLSMGITTNGIRLKRFLPELRAAGLRNINISLDTLVSPKFPLLTRRPQTWHARVMDVLQTTAEQPEFFNVKVNCVMMRGINEDEIGSFMDLAERWPIEVRFLEFMPFDGNSWSAGRLVPQAEIVETMQRHVESRGLSLERAPPESLHDVARLWRVPGWQGRLGVISSMTNAFCGGCNRLRLTAEGELRNCLFGEEGWSLRDEIRAGKDNDALARTIHTGTRKKFAKLGGKRDMHELKERGSHGLKMMTLGG